MKYFRLFTLLAAAAAFLHAQGALPKGIKKNVSVEGITEYQLENGLKVLLFPDASKPKVTVNVTYLVGSKHENYGETGMAHLLEHLVFKGTPTRKLIWQELTDHGAQFNGTTSLDRTNYYEVLNSTSENIKWAIEMEADRMVNSRIAKSDLDSEMTVVRNEFEMGENNPMRVLLQRTMALSFDWHNYGKSTIGARADIENVPIERLQGFYRKYYQPDNALLVIAGKFEESMVLELVAKNFGAIPRPTRKLDKTYTSEPTQDGERTVTVRRVGDIQMILAMHHVPAGTHPDFPAIEVLSAILGHSPTGRLYKALVDNKKAASVMGFEFQQAEPGLLVHGATVRKEQSMEEASKIFLATIESAVTEPPSKEEVDRAKTNILKQVELALTDSEQVGLQLSEWASMADWRMIYVYRDRLKAVTVDDVMRVAKAYLKADNRSTGRFIPTEKPDRSDIPVAPDVAPVLSAFKGSAVVDKGEVFDPTPENVEARIKRAQLPNGLKLVMMPKLTRGNIVRARITLRYGDEKSLFGKSNAAVIAWSMLMRGTTKHSRQQLQDEFDKLKAQVGVGGNWQFGTANIETVRANLPAVLKLVTEVLREPAFPESEFEQIKQAALAGVESMRRDPQFMASNALRRHNNTFPRGDVRAVRTPEEEVEDINKSTLADAKQFYKDFFGGSSDAVMTVVGDMDPAELQTLAGQLLGDWKTPRPVERVLTPYKKVPPTTITLEAPDKANAMFLAGTSINMNDEDPEYPALMMANYLFGGTPASRLFGRLRQKEGWSYGAGSQLNVPIKNTGASFLAYGILAPANIVKLEAGYKEELEKARTAGFTDEEVAKAKSSWLQEETVARSEDMMLLGQISSNAYWGRTLRWTADMEKKVAALTAAQINAALKKYFDPATITIVRAGDFKKAGVTP